MRDNELFNSTVDVPSRRLVSSMVRGFCSAAVAVGGVVMDG